MRHFPGKYDDDSEELDRLNAEPWMLEYLKLNPGYVSWGPREDHMSTNGEGWESSKELDGWSTFGPWNLDDLNECVNFYFEIDRDSANCADCDRSGYNPATKEIADTFYDHGATGRRWCDNITQDEVDALVEAGRLRKWSAESGWVTVPRTAAEVNAANAQGAKHSMELDHDGINRHILIKTRAKRLGVYGLCPTCDGRGDVFTQPAGHLNVVLWMLHPRKGCSRGVRVKNLTKADAEAAKQWLAIAARRNADRFARLMEP